MPEKKIASVKIAKASGGCCQFAKVTVQSSPRKQDSLIELLPDQEADRWWFSAMGHAAISGAEYALHHLPESTDQNWLVQITDIVGTVVDTSEDAVTFATCFAVWEAIGVEGISLPYWQEGRAVFPPSPT